MVEALERYTREHVSVGSFLQAVIENDFLAAVRNADSDNLDNLPAFASYVYTAMPASSHGSPKRYAEWIKEDLK